MMAQQQVPVRALPPVVVTPGASMPSIVPTFSQGPAITDGYKFQVNTEVEYVIPDEDLYWSFGWLRGTSLFAPSPLF
jgi:hypothetical protein